MKILLVSTNYNGGAAIACRRVHQALVAAGYDSSLLVLDKVDLPEEKSVYSVQEIISEKYGAWYFMMLKQMNRILNKLPVFFNKKVYINGPASVFRIEKLEIYKKSDIIHFHWVPKIISYKHVFSDKQKIFFWTLHDMNAFTGGNHYTLDYDYSPFEKLLQCNIEKKKRYLKNANLTITPTSIWLGDLARNSEVFRSFPVKVIPACINTNEFRPIEKSVARKALNILHPDKKIILFVAENTNDKRKGVHLLLSALDKIKNKSKICVLTIGKELKNVDLNFPVQQLGVVRNKADLINCYNAADFFVIPSIEDNLPNTVLESMACGTPVLGFNIGGIPDMVINGKTGLLCDINDEPGFIKNIETMVEMEDYSSFSVNGRAVIEEKFSGQKVVEQIIALYKKAIGQVQD